jgi:hypothetical protein
MVDIMILAAVNGFAFNLQALQKKTSSGMILRLIILTLAAIFIGPG